MNLFDPQHLNLLFPQWQGSGVSSALFHGAKKIGQYFDAIHFHEIDVPEKQDLMVLNQILGYDAILSQLESAARVIRRKTPETIFIAGGDCSVELAPVSYLNRHYHEDMVLIWFDAHGDLNTPLSSPSKHFHGMPLRTLCGEGDGRILSTVFPAVQPGQVVLAGAREFDAAELEYIQDRSIPLVTVEALEKNPGCLADEIKKKGGGTVYLHIDLDVLDPVSYKNIKHPTPDGLSFNALYRSLLDITAGFSIAGLGIVEFVPHNDTGLTEIETILNIFR